MSEIPSREMILKGLQTEMPITIFGTTTFDTKNVGLVIVDEVNGFCQPGAGNLAPPAPDGVIEAMIDLTNKLARQFVDKRKPIMIFKDTHNLDVPEPPYPPHCVKGTGEEELVEKLQWLEKEYGDSMEILEKDCINGFIGSIDNIGNRVQDWVEFENLEAIVVVGICTDICDLQFVQTILSARNHGMLGRLTDIVVVVPACATYDLPLEITQVIGLPTTAAHPRDLTQHIGLYLMQASGAILTNEIILD
ncbi:MAG: isochorismatase family protein [Candidatus Buchananbacteria bacterium]|nr:isochorismatase family protein [Candidatus Buchananbacteria bacterium]